MLEASETRWRARLERLAWLGPLLCRASLGAVFIASGWGKLQDLGKVSEFFGQLGIPLPGFNARLVAVTELVGGAAVLLGLGTRVASLPLAFTMAIAILTAKRGEIDGPRALLALEEFTYLAVLVWLALAGAGRASIDHLVMRSRTKHQQRKGEQT
jgi:putative oxidoreductase